MKIIAILIVVGLAACASSPVDRQRIFVGVLAEMSYRAPDGEMHTSSVLELSEPITVPDVPEPATRMELLLSEETFGMWRNIVGRKASVTCAPTRATLWGYPHASCSVTELVAAP